MFPPPFGDHWPPSFEDLADFLEDAGQEALTWECKGGEVHPGHVVKTAAAFANSELGGYLILGPVWREGRWRLESPSVPEDATAWVASAVDRLSPRPFYDARTLDVPGGGRLVVVAIEASPVPPVLTPDGVIVERTVGQSPPVRDPARLAALFARGDAAEQAAVRAAGDAITGIYKAGASEGRLPAVAVGVAAIAENLDRESTLFTPAFVELMARVLGRWWDRGGNDCRPRVDWHEDRLDGRLECVFHGDREARLAARLDGAASVALYDAGVGSGLGLVQDRALLEALWSSARDLLTALAPDARQVVLSLAATAPGPANVVSVERRISLEGDVAGVLGSVHRELRRARGEPVYEP